VRVLGTGFERALQADARAGARYTLVFVDPPYERYAGIEPALARLVAPLLAPLAVVVVETAASARITLPWAVVREKRYGDTKVTFLVAEPADEQKEPATTMDAATHDGGAAR
jgi:16S rRNA (guanine966-N2)-methyltransferase